MVGIVLFYIKNYKIIYTNNLYTINILIFKVLFFVS